MAEFYGIDLGTTYSCIAKINSDDIVEVIPVKKLHTTPSAVAFDNSGNLIVGKAAKHNLKNEPKDTVILVKREMSNKNYSRTIQGKTYDPVDISSFILKALVDAANEKRVNEEGKDPISDVVITVPAYFGMLEKERTIAAGKKAGLNVMQLINEPTAAALSYGRKQQSDKTLLVYDLGGGTFDVSIMEFKNGIVNTLATDGDHHLGGADWDRIIVDIALEKIGFSFDSLNEKDQYGMILAAEEVKILLSETDSTTMTFNLQGLRNVEITRREFESRTEQLMNRTMLLVDSALDLANKTEEDIDEIILVGGSCYMPMVKPLVDEKFGKSAKLVDPDYAVAKGAALTAAQNDKGYVKGGLIMGMDKGSRAYGMLVVDNQDREFISTLIERNDDLVVEKVFDNNKFQTQYDGQTKVIFNFYEYESDELVLDVNPEWELKGREDSIRWGTPAPKGTPVKIIASRDKNGVVKVFAECMGAKGEFVIVSPGCNINIKR